VALGAASVVAVVVVAVAAMGDRERTASRGDGLVAADVVRNTPVPPSPALTAGLDLAGWARGVAASTGVPARALRAYGAAELAQREATPQCRLSWTTLAAVGRVESDHGRFGRADLAADGVARPPIIGIALDGTRNTREIRDTDRGLLDGDAVHDRAVGPMQFLPTTWAQFGRDGNGDGARDPHQLDDAAAATAAYLCASGRDTASGEGWWDGVLTYNRSVSYARLVWAAADRYATAP
jgi:membrane-bound lytic murein transglycosylase B